MSYSCRSTMLVARPSCGRRFSEMSSPLTILILAISAASKNAEAAAKFVEFCVKNLSNTARYEMKPTLNEPVESAAYHARVAELQEELDDLTTQFENADQDTRTNLEEKIIRVKSTLARLEEHKWEISPESIEVYRAVAGNLKVNYDSPLLSGESGGYDPLRTVVNKYCAKTLAESDIDALITELDRVATMVYLESM